MTLRDRVLRGNSAFRCVCIWIEFHQSFPKVLTLLALVVRFAPFNTLRLAALRAMPGVRIGNGVRIGFGNRFAVERLAIADGVQIGRFNRFVGPVSISIGAGTRIGARNAFGCDHWVKAARYVEQGYARSLRIGAQCLVTDEHFFDCAGRIEVGDGTWFAGRASQVWTHGVGVAERDVVIARRCYLGSAVRLAPGARLGDECVLSLGSVLTNDFAEAKCALIAGTPAKLVKQLEKDYATGRLERHGKNR